MSDSRQPPVVAIVGPTAVGKSALGMVLAERLAEGGEIVNADALQVYRGFDLGTAKPTEEDRRRVPHHLVDVLGPDERYSAGEFARRATAAIAEIRGRGRRPIVVGGSGLYLRALLDGISPIPTSDPEVRRELSAAPGGGGPGRALRRARAARPGDGGPVWAGATGRESSARSKSRGRPACRCRTGSAGNRTGNGGSMRCESD